MSPQFRPIRRSRTRRWRRSASGLRPSIKSAFDQGIVHLAAGDYAKAEAELQARDRARCRRDRAADLSWRRRSPRRATTARRPAPGRRRWSTARICRRSTTGSARRCCGRTTSARRARSTRRRSAKWPADTRFTKPLAMLYGTFGKGREAVRTLERYLEERQDDRDAYLLRRAVDLHRPRRRRRRSQPRRRSKRAHAYADAYAKANGPQLPLVKQWVDFLENEKR